MYKEFYMNAILKNDTPLNIVKILKYMTGDMEIDDISITQDALFKIENWQYILQSESSRFDSTAKSSVDFSSIDDCYYLRVSCSLNNDKMQIEKFLGFINPYLNKQPGDFLGYVRDEDSNEPLILLKT